jgi:hypothetical protein
MLDATREFVEKIASLQLDMQKVDDAQSDDTGLATRHAPGYMRRTFQPKFYDDLETTIRNMYRQPKSQKQLERFHRQLMRLAGDATERDAKRNRG